MKRDNNRQFVDSKLLQNDAYLRKTVESIIQHYEPIEIYLFGSKARGEDGPNSDYDLLVVVRNRVPRDKRNQFHELRRKRGLTEATDVVIFTKEGFESRLDVKTSLPATVVEEGKLLYAA